MYKSRFASGPFRLNLSIVLLTLLTACASIAFDYHLDYQGELDHTRKMITFTAGELTEHIMEETDGVPDAIAKQRLHQLLKTHLSLPGINVFAALRDGSGNMLRVLKMDETKVAAVGELDPLLDRTFVERGDLVLYPLHFGRSASVVIGFGTDEIAASVSANTLATSGFVAAVLVVYIVAVFRRVRNEIERPLTNFFDERLNANLRSIVSGTPHPASELDLSFLPASLHHNVRHSLDLLDVWIRHKSNLDEFIALSIMETNKTELIKNLHRVLIREFPLANLTVCEINQSQNRLQLAFSASEQNCAEDIFTEPHRCTVFRSGAKLIQYDDHRLCEACMQPDECTAICAPLIAGSKQMGVCKVVLDRESLQEHYQFAHSDREKLSLIDAFLAPYFNLTSLSLSNLTLLEAYKNQALTDALTGLYNRRYLVEYLSGVLNLSKRNSANLSVFMIDVDDFKRLNDEFGHKTGDLVLRTIARTMRDNVRNSDVIGRYGGEEFIVVLPETGEETANHVAERLRSSVAAIEWDELGLGQLPRVTISLGIAHFPLHGYSHYHLTNSADKALYRAKQEGKNRVAVHDNLPIGERNVTTDLPDAEPG